MDWNKMNNKILPFRAGICVADPAHYYHNVDLGKITGVDI